MTGAHSVAHAAGWGDKPPASQMRLISFKPIVKGSLRGFANCLTESTGILNLPVELPIGLTIEDCPVLIGRDGAWAALPSRPVLDREGRHARPDGKPLYASIVKWRDRDLQTASATR